MSDKWLISRRTVLRGIGASVALPLLDCMVPSRAGSMASAAAAAGKPPVRMAFFFFPNGANMENWTPKVVGPNFDLPPSLEPLKKIAGDLNVLSGLTLDNARAKGDGPGDHARSAASFLTGAHPYKTAGADIKLGVSVDQIAANALGLKTRLPSLEIGLDKGRTAGECDSGYSCAYVSNISWRSESSPMPHEADPASLFDRLFGNGEQRAAAVRLKEARYRKSILDAVAADAKRLQGQLGKSDVQKLDEYTSSIRDIEKRIEASIASVTTPVKVPNYPRPQGIPADFTEHMRLMCDLFVLALQTDSTRVATFMTARDGSNRQYKWLGLTEGHHTLSHHGKKPENIEAIRKIDLYHMQQIAYVLERMKSIKEGTGTLLDNSMVIIGSGISDGDRHNHDDLPILLAGKAGGAIRTGRHLTYPKNTPLCNLYLSLLAAMGVKMERFGDSTGVLPLA